MTSHADPGDAGGLLRTLMRHSAEALFLVDRETGAILQVNAQAASLLGYSPAELHRLSWSAVQDGHPLPLPPEAADWSGSAELRTSNGHVFRSELSLGGFELEGRRVALVFARADAQRHPELGYALERARRERAEAETHRAQVADRMKDEFLATLSHELRTPLNAILGWTQTLQRIDSSGELQPETFRRALGQIERSARAQAKLIDDLLNISDIAAGRLRLDMHAIRLTPAVQAVLDSLGPAIEAKGIVLEASLDGVPDTIRGDPVRLQQIVWNLLANAVKFTPAAGAIRVALACRGNCLELSVSDTGEGISPEFLPHVFDRFRQADSSSRKRHGGLGLGLSIARQLAEMHAGTIEATSDGAGRGATFVLRLPLAGDAPHADEGRDRPVHGPAAAPRPRPLRGLKVLTVDDDPGTREMLREALTYAGAEVAVAGSAREALERLAAFRPDVLVSDIGMPEEDGHDLVRKLRSFDASAGGKTPAVALTGYAREEDRAASYRAGYQAVTPKPVNLGELVATIAELAARPRGR